MRRPSRGGDWEEQVEVEEHVLLLLSLSPRVLLSRKRNKWRWRSKC
jgi:hypothetical protein